MALTTKNPTEPTHFEKTKQELVETLARLGGEMPDDQTVEHSGTKIVLPEHLTNREAIRFLERFEASQQEEVEVYRTFDYRPWDGANAFASVVEKYFGAMIQKATWSFFGKEPPSVITIPTGPHSTKTVPWGNVELPVVENFTATLGSDGSEKYGIIFALTIHCLKRDEAKANGFLNLIEEELKTNSLYRGKSISGQVNADFLDFDRVDPKRVVYSDEVGSQLEANVWGLLRYTDVQRGLGLPLKRSVLLEGPYGTGKSLAAALTGQIANRNGWTFIYARPGQDNLKEVLQTAQLYQPCVVFTEDIENSAGSNSRGQNISVVLDMFDGIQTKGTEILVVLTTNHPEQLHKAMLRPGRIDAVIHIAELDRNGVERLVRALVPANSLSPNVDFNEVAESMAGFVPAFVTEAVSRATRYSLTRTGGTLEQLETVDFVLAASGLRPQLDLMTGAADKATEVSLVTAFKSTVEDAVRETFNPDLLLTKISRAGVSSAPAINGR